MQFRSGRGLTVVLFALAAVWTAGCGSSSNGVGSGTGGNGGGGSNPQVITFTLSGPAATAAAVKIGSGSFQLTSINSGKISFQLPTGTTSFAVAVMCPWESQQITNNFGVTSEEIVAATTADGTNFPLSCTYSLNSGSTGTLTGAVDATAFPSIGYIDVYATNGLNTMGTELTSSGSFSFAAPAGSDRVEVLAFESSNTVGRYLSAAKSFTGQQVPGALNGGNTVTLGSGDATTTQTIAYSNVPSGYSGTRTLASFNLGNSGSNGGFFLGVPFSSQYPVLPAGAVQSGDFYDFVAQSFNSSDGGQVLVDQTTASAGPMTFTFPAAWSYSGPTPAAFPSFTYDYTRLAGKPNLAYYATLDWPVAGTSNGGQDYEYIFASSSYMNGSTTIAFPDLSQLTGFLQSAPSGTSIYWGAGVSSSSWPLSQQRPIGSTVTAAVHTGSLTVP